MLHRHISQRFLDAMSRIEHGSIDVKMPDGRSYFFSGKNPGAAANICIHDWHVIPGLAIKGDIALAESYRDGLWETEDLTDLFLFGLQNQKPLDSYIHGSAFGRLASNIAYLFTRNTIKGSKKNIQAHYDLGNEFYKLWLDPSMTYSSAIFANQNEPLEDAQKRKYDRIIERINSSGRLLEIGCGWGGFAERALQTGDYGIKGLTISQAQYDFATRRVGKDALIALEDYRHQNGLYDQIVSIEMFEAVGEQYWPVYFSKIKSLLAQKGKALVQTITISDENFSRYRNGGDAIRSFIFPGGMLPSPSRFKEESMKSGLKLTDQYAFGNDYALTMTQWLKNFDMKVKEVKAMGFDDKFIRMWRFYLTCCIAAFKHGHINVMQMELQHAA